MITLTEHEPNCGRYSTPSAEGTVCIVEPCTCGYEAQRQRMITECLERAFWNSVDIVHDWSLSQSKVNTP